MDTLNYMPTVRPSAIALGTIFTHATSLAVLGPAFGATYQRARRADTKEEFLRSREAASALAAWSCSLVGAAARAYGVGALMNAAGVVGYKGAVCIGTLVMMAAQVPTLLSQFLLEKRPADTVAVGALAHVVDTVGLSLVMAWWGTRAPSV